MKNATAIFLLLFLTLTGQAQQKPNIIFIMSDDHTSQAIGAYGGAMAQLSSTQHL